MNTIRYKSYGFTPEKLSLIAKSFVEKERCSFDEFNQDGYYVLRLRTEKFTCDTTLNVKEKTLTVFFDADTENGTKFIRHLAKERIVSDKRLTLSDMPIECTGDVTLAVADVIAGRHTPDMPIVYLSRSNSSHALAGNVDEYRLAKRLFGIAHVVTATPSSEQELNKLLRGTKRYAPYDGCAGVFSDGGYEFLRSLDSSSSYSSSETQIFDFVIKHCKVKPDVTPDELILKREKAKKPPAQTKVSPAVKEKDKTAKERPEISDLRKKLTESEEKNKLLKNAIKNGSIVWPGIEEARENEFVDFVIGCIQEFSDSIPENEFSRRKMLCHAFLSVNEQSSFEKERYLVLKDMLDEGKFTPSELERLGYSDVRSGKHINFKHAGIRCTAAITPSDVRTRQNELGDIVKSTFVTGKRPK